MTFTVDDPTAFAESDEVNTALTNSFATHVGVSTNQVTVTITVAAARRLSQGRRLAGGVVVEYVITGAVASVVTALNEVAADPAALTVQVNQDLASQNIVISGATFTAVAAPVDVATPQVGEPGSSGSSEVFLSTSVVGLLVVLASANFVCISN